MLSSRSHREVVAAIASAALATAPLLACGDLIIPSNGPDTTSDSGVGDGGSAATSPDAVSMDARPAANCDAGTHPVALSCTGLYSDWTQLTLSPDVQPYQPGATAWADGADSSRWIWLPPGQKIDTSDPNNWSFPTGTKFWQEMRLLGRRIETRFSWKISATLWFRTTYAWAEDQSAAPELTAGLPNARGLPYQIPSVSDCEKCHNGENDFVLGFEVVGLAMQQSSGLNLQSLAQRGLLSNPPSTAPSIPGDATTAGSLAYLHANCGTSCHNPNLNAGAGQTGLWLKLVVDTTGALPSSAGQTSTWTTSYKVPSNFTPGGYDAGGFWRIKPGDVARSMIPWRASRRDGASQMPPIDTHVSDRDNIQLLNQWVMSLPP